MMGISVTTMTTTGMEKQLSQVLEKEMVVKTGENMNSAKIKMAIQNIWIFLKIHFNNLIYLAALVAPYHFQKIDLRFIQHLDIINHLAGITEEIYSPLLVPLEMNLLFHYPHFQNYLAKWNLPTK